MSVKAIGIDKIEYGTVGDGVPAESFTALTDAIVEDSVKFNYSEPTITPLRQETSKHPFTNVLTQEEVESAEFSLYAPAAATLELLMGGTTTSDKWEEATSIPNIFKTWKFSTPTSEDVEHVEHTIVNGRVFARFGNAPSKKGSETLYVKILKEAAITAAGVENTAYIREIVDDTP